ncbi:MAG: FHA domain-containing protein [Thermoplasmatota archaeon]
MSDAVSLSTDTELDPLAHNLKVLGNPKRLHLLRFLVQPHYIEEIAQELKMARQTAQEHVQRLLDIGVVQRVRGRRDHGPVTDFVVVPQRIFTIHDQLGKLGGLEPELEADDDMRALTTPLETGAVMSPELDLAPTLTIVHGMRIGQTTTLLGEGPWLIGREPEATLCLDYDPFVSSRHTEVRRSADGFEVADLYSSNGTFVDWKPVERGAARVLHHGDIVRVGKSLVVFRLPVI